MSIQYMDNFSFYGTSTSKMLDGLPWAQVGGALANDPDGASSGKVYEMATNTSSSLANSDRIALPTPTDTVGVAQRMWVSALPASTGVRPAIARFASASNVSNVIFLIEPNGAVALYKLPAGTAEATSGLVLVESTVSPAVAPQSWFHYEAKFTASTSAYELRIEGETVLSGTVSSPRATTSTGIVGFSRSIATGGVASYMKDLIVWDGLGSSNKDFLGTCSVYLLPVNSDVSSGWTSTGATNYGVLDETTPDDTDYISADNTPPAASIMGFTDLPADIVSVRGLMTLVRAKKSDGGDADVVVSLISSGDNDAGTTHHVTTSSKYWIDVSELDPHTASAWTPISVNSAEIKIDRTL